MWISRKKWSELEKRVADLEKQIQSQPQENVNAINIAKAEKAFVSAAEAIKVENLCCLEKATRKPLREMIDRICLLQFGCKSEHEVKVMKCDEFIKTIKEMQGTDLEPYLAETKCTTYDRCYNITFKIPIDLDNE